MLERPPTAVVARALRFAEREFRLGDRIDAEQLAESLAFGSGCGPESVAPCAISWCCAPDAFEVQRAEAFAPEWSDAMWRMVVARANWLRREQGLAPLAATQNPA